MAQVLKCTSPKGKLEWVTIDGEGKENLSGKLQYVANVVCDPKDPATVAFIKNIEEFWETNKPKNFKKAPKSNGCYEHKEKTEEVGEDGKAVFAPTGLVYFAFKTGTTFPDGSQKKVKTFNSKAKEVSLGELKIGNGSIGEISGAMGIYETKDPKGKSIIDAGVTLYLDAIKISKLVEYEADSGFAADEDEEDGEGWTGGEDWTGEEEAPAAGKTQPRL